MRCLNHFGSEHILENHMEWCSKHDHLCHVYPNVKTNTEFFKQYQRKHRIPFVVYANFKCLLPPIDNKIGNGTTQYQHHLPSRFCYTITCVDDSIYKLKTVLYTMENEDEDIGKKFVESLESDLKKVSEILTTNVPVKMTDGDKTAYQQAKTCYACGLGLKEDRVRDICHLTGKYRGAAHSKCNLKMKTPTFVPVLFHNLEGYDSHLFVKSLGGEISCIPKTDEKYISFSKKVVYTPEGNPLEIRFLDSVKFSLKGLEGLVKGLGPDQFRNLERGLGTNELLKKKGVFPYEFMSGFSKLKNTLFTT